MFCITFANAFKNERYAEKQKQSKAERAMKKEFFEKIKIQTEVVVQEAVF